MKPNLIARLKYIIEIAEGQSDENILTILKTVIQEFEGRLPQTLQQQKISQFNENNTWRKDKKEKND